MTEVLVLGDMHGNASALTAHLKSAHARGVRDVLQLGDFGYWEHSDDGAGYLRWTNRMLEQYDQTLVFVDGNHENHQLLRERYVNSAHDRGGGLYEVRPRILYACRGARWIWGARFLAMGGAYSIDKEPVPGIPETRHWRRVEGKSWWPEELIADGEIDLAIHGGPCDVLASHDCPDGVDIPVPTATHSIMGKDAFPPSVENRRKLRRLVDAVHPTLVLHGHYHHRYQATLTLETGENVEVHGFDREHKAGSAAIVDFAPYASGESRSHPE